MGRTLTDYEFKERRIAAIFLCSPGNRQNDKQLFGRRRIDMHQTVLEVQRDNKVLEHVITQDAF